MGSFRVGLIREICNRKKMNSVCIISVALTTGTKIVNNSTHGVTEKIEFLRIDSGACIKLRLQMPNSPFSQCIWSHISNNQAK